MFSTKRQNGEALLPQELYRLIQEAAYAKAEARQFAPGVDLQDWLEAEKEVLQRLGIPREIPKHDAGT